MDEDGDWLDIKKVNRNCGSAGLVVERSTLIVAVRRFVSCHGICSIRSAGRDNVRNVARDINI